MDNQANPIELLFEKAEDYSKTSAQLLWLKTIDKSADVVSSLAVRFLIFMIIFLFIFVMNIGIALWIGDLLGKYYYGFFVMAGCYALIALLLHGFRVQWIKTPISNAIITQLLQHKIA